MIQLILRLTQQEALILTQRKKLKHQHPKQKPIIIPACIFIAQHKKKKKTIHFTEIKSIRNQSIQNIFNMCK